MAKKFYTVAGKEFYQDELVYGQLRMLRERLKKYSLDNLSIDSLMDILLGDVTSILSVILIEVEQTQAQKVKAGEDGAKALQAWLDEFMKPAEAKAILPDFFDLNPVEGLTLGFQKKSLEALTPGAGSKNPFVSLPTET